MIAPKHHTQLAHQAPQVVLSAVVPAAFLTKNKAKSLAGGAGTVNAAIAAKISANTEIEVPTKKRSQEHISGVAKTAKDARKSLGLSMRASVGAESDPNTEDAGNGEGADIHPRKRRKTAENEQANGGNEEERAMQQEVEQLKQKLHSSKEKSNYWRRMSLDLESTLTKKKSASMRSIAALEEKIEEMTYARVALQTKVEQTTSANATGLDEIAGLLEVQQELEKDKARLIDEINAMNSAYDENKQERGEEIRELEECLRDTLGDLKQKLGELTSAKEALKRAKKGVEELYTRGKDEDKTAETALKSKCDRREKRIVTLTEMVEKLVFKASVLSQTNSELKAKQQSKVGGGVSEGVKENGSQKMQMLEKMCLQRYSKVLAQATGRVEQRGERVSEE